MLKPFTFVIIQADKRRLNRSECINIKKDAAYFNRETASLKKIVSILKDYLLILKRRSTTLQEYPHSLSYQPTTLTILPMVIVDRASNMHE